MTEQPYAATDLAQRLEFALDAARDAGNIILSYYQQTGVRIDRKGDNSPVTIADQSAEKLIRAGIAKHFGNDGILGEEYGEQPGTSGFRWIVDPLDGTKSFIHGVPLFGTLIGVEYQKSVVLGVCHLPVLQETAYASRKQGAWWKRGGEAPQPARVSAVSDLSQALVCFTTVQGFSRVGRPDALDEIVRSAGLFRGWGDCYGHMLVATGRADAMVDAQMNPWDAAALLPIVEEAGGHFIDWHGQPTIYSGNGISVNSALKDQVLAITAK